MDWAGGDGAVGVNCARAGRAIVAAHSPAEGLEDADVRAPGAGGGVLQDVRPLVAMG